MPNAPKLKLNKKMLVVTNTAPPKIAGGPLQLYNLFSNIDENDYCIFTSPRNFKSRENKFGKKLGCNYYFFENQKKIGLFTSMLCIFVIFIGFNPVIYYQYLTWAIPFIPLAAWESGNDKRLA